MAWGHTQMQQLRALQPLVLLTWPWWTLPGPWQQPPAHAQDTTATVFGHGETQHVRAGSSESLAFSSAPRHNLQAASNCLPLWSSHKTALLPGGAEAVPQLIPVCHGPGRACLGKGAREGETTPLEGTPC